MQPQSKHEKELPERRRISKRVASLLVNPNLPSKTQALAHIQQQIPEEAPIIEGNKVERATKPPSKRQLNRSVCFVEVATKLEGAPVGNEGNKELHDYAGMNQGR